MSTTAQDTGAFDPLTGKPLPVFVRYAVPEVVAMMTLSSAGLVDAMFLGNYVGPTALAAVNLSVPIWALIFGLGIMASVGGSVAAGKLIGAGDREHADQYFSVTTLVVLLSSLTIAILSYAFLAPLILALGAVEAELASALKTYVGILVWFAPAYMLQLVFFYFVKLDGHPRLASSTFIVAGLSNIVLDWLFIVKAGWGIEGAAWATGIAAVLPTLLLGGFFLTPQATIRFTRELHHWGAVLRSFTNGLSEFVNEISGGITIFIFNWVLVSRVGADGVAALTIVNNMMWIGFMFAFGIADSLQPLISQNFGARNVSRIREFVRLAAITMGVVGILWAAFVIAFPEFLVGLFLSDEDVASARIALDFVHLLWPACALSGLSILISGYFTSMHEPLPSALIALSRSFALPAVLLLLLPIWLGDAGIFWVLPMAETLTFLMALVLFARNLPRRLVVRDRRRDPAV